MLTLGRGSVKTAPAGEPGGAIDRLGAAGYTACGGLHRLQGSGP